jgi:hypothetical protein
MIEEPEPALDPDHDDEDSGYVFERSEAPLTPRPNDRRRR